MDEHDEMTYMLRRAQAISRAAELVAELCYGTPLRCDCSWPTLDWNDVEHQDEEKEAE